MKSFVWFLAGAIVSAGLALGLGRAGAAALPDPTPSPAPSVTLHPTHTPFPTRTPTRTPQPSPTPTSTPKAQVQAANGKGFGWPGQIQCFNCSPFQVHIQLTHYNPTQGKFNCYTWSDEFQYCMSPTSSGIPWESVWGFAAACPMEWPLGSWLEIPGVGNFICMDRGDMVICEPGNQRCYVDLLGPGGEAWDQQDFDSTLWVPLKPRRAQ